MAAEESGPVWAASRGPGGVGFLSTPAAGGREAHVPPPATLLVEVSDGRDSAGISAASGKLGAIVAQVGFARLVNIGGTNAFVKHM